MTEEDTFKALKKADYQTVYEARWAASNEVAALNAITECGWTVEEYIDEYHRHYSNRNLPHKY